MITFMGLNGSFFIIIFQLILFSIVFLVVSNKKAVSAIKKFANDYYQWLWILLISIVIGLMAFFYNKINYFDLAGLFNCIDCKIYFVLAYSISLAFLYNFTWKKNKIVTIFFLPLLSLISDIYYFIATVIFTVIGYLLGYFINNFTKVNKIRKKEKSTKFNPFAVIIIFWFVIYLIPFIILPMIFNDGGWIFLYLLFIPVLFSFIPYSIIYSNNKLSNLKFLIFGLILPCILNNILISYIIILAFRNFRLF